MIGWWFGEDAWKGIGDGEWGKGIEWIGSGRVDCWVWMVVE
jgi:hypothetical protein